jgi:hypothetical protein
MPTQLTAWHCKRCGCDEAAHETLEQAVVREERYVNGQEAAGSAGICLSSGVLCLSFRPFVRTSVQGTNCADKRRERLKKAEMDRRARRQRRAQKKAHLPVFLQALHITMH